MTMAPGSACVFLSPAHTYMHDMHCGRHSLPVGDVGLVIPVLPALQRVDIGVHTGLATGHRTRHGDTRDPGAAECGTPRPAGLVGERQET